MDDVDRILDQWKQARPDLDVGPMETIGRVNRLSAALRHRMEEIWKSYGLNAASFDVLATLRRWPDPRGLTPHDLLNATMVTSGTMTNRIDRLEKSGLVERVTNPDDGRSVLVRLTPTGHDLIDNAIKDHVKKQHELVHGLSGEQMRTLNKLLATFMNALERPSKSD